MTAVEFLIEQLIKYELVPKETNVDNVIFHRTKEMEKQQMSKIYEGILQNVGTSIKQSDLPTFEQYYTSTYGSKGSDETKTN